MNAKKLPPSSSPATFAPASVRSRKIDSGSNGDSTRLSITRKRDEQRRGRREQRERPRGAPAVLRRLGDRVDEQHQPAGARDRPEPRRTAGASCASRLSGTIRGASSSAVAPIGTFR